LDEDFLARGFDAPEREVDDVRVAMIQRYRWPLSEHRSDTHHRGASGNDQHWSRTEPAV